MRMLVVALMGLAGWGCAGDEGSPRISEEERASADASTPIPEGARLDPAFAPQPGWSADVQRAVLGDAYATDVVRIASTPAGDRTWVVVRTLAAHDAVYAFGLRAYDARRRLVWSSDEDPGFRARMAVLGASIGDVALHPDGTLSVLALRPLEPVQHDRGTNVRSALHFLRLDRRGTLLAEAPFQPALDPDEGAGMFSIMPFDARGPAGIELANRLLADGEALILLRVYRGGTTLYRLDADYGIRRSAMVYPESGNTWWYAPKLARDARGRIAVLTGTGQDMLDELALAGGPRLTMPVLDPPLSYKSASALLQYFEGESLERIAAHVVALPGALFPQALTAGTDGFVAVMAGRFTRADRPNDTQELDVVIVRVEPEARPHTYHLLDVARDDAVADALVDEDGTLWLAGSTNYVQVDTSSRVEDSEGLVVGVDSTLARGTVLRLPGPRSVELNALAIDDDALSFGGNLDAPITHTCDGDEAKSACFRKGFLAHWPRARSLSGPLVELAAHPLPR